MGPRPLVAVVAYQLRPGRVTEWVTGAYAVPEPYVDAVRRAGGVPELVLPGDERTPKELLPRFEALLLVGGGDVEPWRFNQEAHEQVSGLEPDRDAIEMDLLREADRRGMPSLCICRGMQILNVAFGGTLVQHLPDDRRFQRHGTRRRDEELLHDVEVVPGSRLERATGARVLACSSHHHQGVDRLGAGLAATARTADGLVEGLEREDDGWIVGVQWHPEDTAAADPAQQGLFDALIERAR